MREEWPGWCLKLLSCVVGGQQRVLPCFDCTPVEMDRSAHVRWKLVKLEAKTRAQCPEILVQYLHRCRWGSGGWYGLPGCFHLQLRIWRNIIYIINLESSTLTSVDRIFTVLGCMVFAWAMSWFHLQLHGGHPIIIEPLFLKLQYDFLQCLKEFGNRWPYMTLNSQTSYTLWYRSAFNPFCINLFRQASGFRADQTGS